uniref:BORCS6 domain-containing protein n=1 Tax=Panagrellus redivivus TaxID=6233 RepID=A0A7E4VUP1_PANRE
MAQQSNTRTGVAAEELAQRISALTGFDNNDIDGREEATPSSSNPSLLSSPEHQPGRVGAPRTGDATLRRRRPSDDLIPDPMILQDLETHARAIASDVDMCLRDLRGSLRGMSDLTLEFMQTYSSTIFSTCDNVDTAIKGQYKLIAKAEELSDAMQDAKKIAQQAKDMKRLVELLESRLVDEKSTSD